MTYEPKTLTRTYVKRAVHKLGGSLELLHRQRACKVADCIVFTEAPLSIVLAAVWPERSRASARRALHRLQAKIAVASADSGWPLILTVRGRGETAVVCFKGKCPEFAPCEMGATCS